MSTGPRPDILVLPYHLFGLYRETVTTSLSEGTTRLEVTAGGSVPVSEADLLAQGINAFWDLPISQKHLQQLVLRLLDENNKHQLITRFGRQLQEHSPDPGQVQGIRILLAEDNIVNQNVATQMLVRLGCEVALAANGQEAVELYRQNEFDLVLMDCHMPVMDGLEATRQIHSLAQCRQMPVIALPADVTAEQKTACKQAGMNGYLSEPIRLEELRQALCGFLYPDQSALP